MKITLENLEKLIYRPDRHQWQDKKWRSRFYIYKESCKNCGKPFLSCRETGLFCNNVCANTKENHPSYGKKRSKETKKKMSKIVKKRNKNTQTCLNYKGGVVKRNIPLYDTYAHQISFCESVRRNEEDPNILEVKCAYCGKWFIPAIKNVRNRIKALNGKSTSGSELKLYCSEQCKKECPIYRKQKYQVGHPDSNKNQCNREVQAELRQMCMKRDEYTCQICGLTQNELDVGLHCHHIEGIKHNPLESADLDMVITLCKECHKNVHKLPGCNYNDMKC